MTNEGKKPIEAASDLSDLLGTWTPTKDALPEPMEEVLVWIDGHRGPSWRNNHALVAYRDNNGDWWEERHPSKEPLVGVFLWKMIGVPSYA
jgi:hypothetical protein